MRRRRVVTLILGGGLLLFGTAVLLAYEAELRPLRAKVLAGGRLARTAAGRLEYGTSGTGPPLLVIHGASGGYDQGLLIGTSLVGERFQVIAPSRFGYLRTPFPQDASPAAQADAHAALLEALGIPSAVVLGVSAGAPSAMQLALRHPDRVSALVLLSPLGYAPDSQVPLPAGRTVLRLLGAGDDFIYWALLHLSPSSLTRLVGVPPELLDRAGPDDRQWADQFRRSVLPLSMRMAGVSGDLAVRQELHSGPWPLERITAPTLLMTCSDDLFRTKPAAEYAAAHIPRATLVVYPTGGHLFIGHLGEVQRTVSSFLTRSLPS